MHTFKRMVSKKILSLQHPHVKKWIQLRNEAAARSEENQVLLIGEKMVREAAERAPLKTLISVDPINLPAHESYLVTPEILKKISGVQSPDGVAGIVSLPNFSSFLHKSRILLLDRISDPGNLGSILRTASAFGWDGALLTPDSVDPFNEKALRASRGASLIFPTRSIFPEEIVQWINTQDLQLWVADTHGTPFTKIPPPTSILLALCNEGAGPSPWLESIGKKLTIPQSPQIESLGVAAAGAILLHYFGKFP